MAPVLALPLTGSNALSGKDQGHKCSETSQIRGALPQEPGEMGCFVLSSWNSHTLGSSWEWVRNWLFPLGRDYVFTLLADLTPLLPQA